MSCDLNTGQPPVLPPSLRIPNFPIAPQTSLGLPAHPLPTQPLSLISQPPRVPRSPSPPPALVRHLQGSPFLLPPNALWPGFKISLKETFLRSPIALRSPLCHNEHHHPPSDLNQTLGCPLVSCFLLIAIQTSGQQTHLPAFCLRLRSTHTACDSAASPCPWKLQTHLDSPPHRDLAPHAAPSQLCHQGDLKIQT